jgi:hypothetical protein
VGAVAASADGRRTDSAGAAERRLGEVGYNQVDARRHGRAELVMDSFSATRVDLVRHRDGYCRELRVWPGRNLAPGQAGKPLPRDRLAGQPVTADYPHGMSSPGRMPLTMPFLAQYDPQNGRSR